MRKKKKAARRPNKIKMYFGVVGKYSTQWFDYKTLKEAKEMYPVSGETIYKATLKKVGRINENDKFIPIKRRKK